MPIIVRNHLPRNRIYTLAGISCADGENSQIVCIGPGVLEVGTASIRCVDCDAAGLGFDMLAELNANSLRKFVEDCRSRRLIQHWRCVRECVYSIQSEQHQYRNC